VCSVHLRNHTHTTPATTLLCTPQPRPNPAREQLQAEKLWELAAKLAAKYDVGAPPAGLSQQEHAYAMLQGEGVRLSFVSASGRAHFKHNSSNTISPLPTIADILGLKVRQAAVLANAVQQHPIIAACTDLQMQQIACNPPLIAVAAGQDRAHAAHQVQH